MIDPENELSLECPYTEAQIDDIIAAAGGLPSELYEAPVATDDNARIDGDIGERRSNKRMCDRRDALKEKLAAAFTYSDLKRWAAENKVTPSDLVKSFDAIEKHANRILTNVGEAGAENMLSRRVRAALAVQAHSAAKPIAEKSGYRFAEPLAAQIVNEHIKSIIKLRDWTVAARKIEEREKTPRNKCNGGDADLIDLFASLAGIYSEIFERRPGLSRAADGSPAGPYFRFGKACIEPFKNELALETRNRKQKKTLDGILYARLEKSAEPYKTLACQNKKNLGL